MIASMGPSFQTTLTVVLKNPQVGHKVRVQDFEVAGVAKAEPGYETLYNAL